MAAYIASQIARSLEESSCFSLSCFILASIEYYCSASSFCALAKCSIAFVAFFKIYIIINYHRAQRVASAVFATALALTALSKKIVEMMSCIALLFMSDRILVRVLEEF